MPFVFRLVGSILTVTFIAAFGWFAFIQMWHLALWSLGAAFVSMAVCLILEKPDV